MRGRAASLSVGLLAAWAIAATAYLATSSPAVAADDPAPSPDLAAQFLAGPMKDLQEVVFATREVFGEHWYANIGYYSTDRQSPLYRKGGRLCKLDLRSGKLTLLVDDPEGSIRDPAVHYDGRRIVFAYRKGGTENYLLYTINADGTGLAQLTAGLYDDYEPCWLPDDGLVFVTTRAKRWVGCWLTQVGNVWRCDAGGKELRPLSANLEHDNTPWIMPDGRIVHMRWEYVDRSQVDYHHLWTMNPDGTKQAVCFGNLHPGGVYLDAKPIPGSDRIVLIHSPGHGQTEHMGFLATLDVKGGPDDLARLRNVTRQADFRDPWAFGDGAYMAAEENRLVLVDGQGRTATLFTMPKEFGNAWLHEPRPLVARDREANILPVAKLDYATGRFMLDNVYRGRNMAGVKPGEIKRLMVVESLPKPVNFTGGMDPLSYKGTFTLERVLGSVPVEEDGSAYFEAPALRSLFFIALDENGRSVKRMQSFTTLQPGETLGCLGCHESRATSPPLPRRGSPGAARHRPSKIEPYAGVPEVIDYPRDIQPVLDRLCVRCHDDRRRDGGVLLTGDRGPMFSHSYYTLSVWKQIADGRNDAKSNYPPRALGSGGAALVDKLDRRHYDVQATEHDRLLVRLWLDVGAPYPGTYAALGCGSIGGYIQNNQVLNNDADWPETKAAQPVFSQRCAGCHEPNSHPVARSLSDEIGLSFWAPDMNDPRLKHSRHIVFNLSRPERSLVLLAPLARRAGGYGLCRPKGAPAEPGGEVFSSCDDPGYRLILAMCEAGRRKLEAVKRFDMPGFRPRPEYVRELKRFGVLPEAFDLAKDPLDVYDADRRYWASLEYRPTE